jgi:hypothetical protein
MRGWGDSAKRRRLNSLLKSGAFVMCLLQETKPASFTDSMIHALWGHKDVEWVAKESSGLSDSLLSIWNKDLFSFRFNFTSDGFLGICVEWKDCLLYIVTIYSPCTLFGKRKLWNDLLEFKLNNDPSEWCLWGDFNSVTRSEERRGTSNAGSNVERNNLLGLILTVQL